MRDANCIFCKIERREVPAFLVYEDAQCLAFLDVRQVSAGHTLVIPRNHINHVQDVPDELASHLFLTTQKIARHYRNKLDAPRIGYVLAGFGVPHVHFHIIPMWHEHDITSRAYTAIVDGQLDFSMTHAPITLDAERKATQELLKL